MPINPVQHPVLDVIENRWSPYRLNAQPVEDEKILQCLEAARWAASSFNDQPWSWIVARRQDSQLFDKSVSCLLEANQGWAQNAGVLLISVIRTTFRRNNKPNRVALHDLGQSAAHLSLQATQLGLQVHQMAGLNLSATRQAFQIPEGHQPETAIAMGYPDLTAAEDPAGIELQKREQGARQRMSLGEQVFEGTWGTAARIVREA
ncbi:malonic semialdehyde reductase [Rubripirellula lacrimiformis]|uniref:Malonic semialdehyde reductase n=1 Tax=Rubripirellula lacrimiformis TaxID=1930273 RepID=A0A517NC04_9BACT|nr:nitroreductase family protein [Rubripirellula lacrimiformis]QDT04663.1 malonic semialdehyde reductase [Rubripirellula lacrimiformis]